MRQKRAMFKNRREVLPHLTKAERRMSNTEMDVRISVASALTRRIMTMPDLTFRQIADLGFAVGVRFTPKGMPDE